MKFTKLQRRKKLQTVFFLHHHHLFVSLCVDFCNKVGCSSGKSGSGCSLVKWHLWHRPVQCASLLLRTTLHKPTLQNPKESKSAIPRSLVHCFSVIHLDQESDHIVAQLQLVPKRACSVAHFISRRTIRWMCAAAET